MSKIPVRYIEFTDAEGYASDHCPCKVSSFAQANAVLRSWAKHAPRRGYDKVWFTIRYEDGAEYRGRYDLQHTSVELPDLARHLRWTVGFYAGKRCPPHSTEEEYRQALKVLGARNPEFLDAMFSFHERYAMSDLDV